VRSAISILHSTIPSVHEDQLRVLHIRFIMRSPPPEVLKSWPKPNYENPTTRGNTLMILELTLLPIAMVVVFLRMWVRISWLKRCGIDDWIMCIAMASHANPHSAKVSGHTNIHQIFSIGTTVLVILASQVYGWDRHVWDALPSTLETGRKVSSALCNWCHFKLTLTTTRHHWLARHYSFSPLRR
jgi:hypothetical protein